MNDLYQKPSEDTVIVSLSDLWDVFVRCKTKIALSASIMLLLSVCFVLSRPISFHVEATFRERENKDVGMGSPMNSYFRLPGSQSLESHAASMMKSRILMEGLVKRLNLQAHLGKKGESKGLLTRMKDNLLIEYAYFKGRAIPLFPDPKEALICTSVTYPEEIANTLEIRFNTNESYEVFNSHKNKIGKGQLNEPFSADNFQFTLCEGPSKKALSGEHYYLSLSPLTSAASSLAMALKIEKDKDDTHLLKISYNSADRLLGTIILNGAMKEYQSFIKEESDAKTDIQLNYLKKREQDTAQIVEKQMRDRAENFSQGITKTGFMDSENRIRFLTSAQADCQQRLVAINLELKRLHRLHEDPEVAFYDRYTSTGDSEVINTILARIRDLKQQRAIFDLALGKAESSSFEKSTNINQESLQEFQGIDANTANQLYLSYQRQLDDIQARIKQNSFIIQQIADPHFEVSTLSEVATDSISKDMVNRASGLLLALRDTDNRSIKEQERIKADLQLQKAFLTSHIQQTTDLEKLREQLIIEKIRALQKVNLNLIHQQISILEKQLDDYLTTRITNLIQEQEIIKNHLNELQTEMAEIPNKWVSEKLFNQQLISQEQMVQEVSRLVESKILSHNLEIIQSAPVDIALAPILPVKPGLLKFAFIGALLGIFLSSAFILMRSLVNGIPCSQKNLVLQGLTAAGTLSQRSDKNCTILPDKDLETLRRLSLLLKGKVWLLAQGSGPDYTHHLASLLAKQGKKVLILPLMFNDINKTEEPGLLQFIEKGIQPLIHTNECYDIINGGGISRYSSEYLRSFRFADLLSQLRQKYDYILAVNQTPPLQSEAESLLSLVDSASITLQSENLNTVVAFAQKHHKTPMAFINF